MLQDELSRGKDGFVSIVAKLCDGYQSFVFHFGKYVTSSCSKGDIMDVEEQCMGGFH